MIGQIVIAIALIEFNDLGRSVTPTFLFRNRFNLQLSPQCPKMTENSMSEVKNFKISVQFCHLAAARRVKLWPLIQCEFVL